MDDLGLAVPLEVTTQESRWVVGESSGVETSVTREGSVKGGRPLVEGESRGSVGGLVEGDAKGRSGMSSQRTTPYLSSNICRELELARVAGATKAEALRMEARATVAASIVDKV